MSYNQFKFRVSLDNVDAYELTGADRTAEIDVQALADSTLDVDNVSNVISGFGNANRAPYAKPFGAIKFTAKEAVHVNGVKAIIEGLPEARHGAGLPAFKGSVVASDGTNDAVPVALQLEEYGVEYPANFDIRPADAVTGEWGIYYGTGSKFSIDDFAVLSDFVGQSGKATLEFTAEIVGADNV